MSIDQLIDWSDWLRLIDHSIDWKADIWHLFWHLESVSAVNASMRWWWSTSRWRWEFLIFRWKWCCIIHAFAVECFSTNSDNYTRLTLFDSWFSWSCIQHRDWSFSWNLQTFFFCCRDQFNIHEDNNNQVEFFRRSRSADWDDSRWITKNLFECKFTDHNSRCREMRIEILDKWYIYWVCDDLLFRDQCRCRKMSRRRRKFRSRIEMIQNQNFDFDLWDLWERNQTLHLMMQLKILLSW
jgi:hypothetical protein